MKYKNLQFADVYNFDAPDFVDAYVVYAEHADGSALTDEELEQLNNNGSDVHDLLWAYLY